MRNALQKTSEQSREIVSRLADGLRVVGGRRRDRIISRVGEYWIALRSERADRIFAEIRPLRARVEVFILPSPRDLRDPDGLVRRAPRSQGWGWFRARFDVRTPSQVPAAVRLLAQSYEYGRREPNGRGLRRKLRAQTV